MHKLDLKDLKIIKELDQDPDIATSQLAKKIGVSQQVADYRLKNLQKNKVIFAILPLIDMSKLGYTLFRVHVRFKQISEQKKSEFESFIKNNSNCFFIGSVGGRWDHYFDIFAESALQFQESLAQIISRFKNEIQEYETFTIVRIHIFNYKYILDNAPKSTTFGETAEKQELDDIDKKILATIKTDSRQPYLQTSTIVGLSRNAIKEHIKRLKEKKIISGNRIFLNSQLMNQEAYKLLLRLRNDPDQKQRLIQFAKIHKNIIYALEMMGPYQLDLEVEIENRELLQDLIIQLRDLFPIIEDYEIMPLFRDSGIDFYPITKTE